ncbi:uncharacterized protein LOC142530458 [Primulina tabacum]|uniref:uncharacterized protein LOC142530458 n=1 Tax=Primulina tabacum TaxID=48773 RepID=UPI003F59A0F5
MNCETLMNQDEHVQSVLHKQSKQMQNDYHICLNASIDCIRVLLRQGHSFRGHDETESSLNQGNFLIQLEFLGAHNKEINDVILKNAPKNCKLTSPDIQKDIQMSVVIRYVGSSGHVNERFIGIEHLTSTTSLSLKAAIDKMFSRYNLSMSKLRGQGFDGASNMQGKFNGLKALILKENPCAFYIHCFAHQLQLALIAVAKKNLSISNFFRGVGDLLNVVGASCKRYDLLREKHSDFIVEALERDEISSGRGLNQETTLQRAGDTCWGSHYNSLIIKKLPFNVLKMIPVLLIKKPKHLIYWKKVHRFCEQHYIDVLKMDDMFTRWAPRGRPHRNPPEMTNLHHYRVDLFYGVIDMQL